MAVYGNIQLTNTLFTVVNINENKKLRKYEMKGRGKRNTVVYLFHSISIRLQIQMDKEMEFGLVQYKINAKLCGTHASAGDFT